MNSHLELLMKNNDGGCAGDSLQNPGLETLTAAQDQYGYKLDPNTCKNIRVMQRSTVYVIGIKKELASVEALSSINFFGQYGEILRISIKKEAYHNQSDKNYYYSAYIHYQDDLSACLAIISIQSKHITGMELMRASYATSNYCKFYVKKTVCRTKGCGYFHLKAPKSECVFDIQKKTGLEIFDAMLSKAFDTATANLDKFCALIKFLEMKNCEFITYLPTTNDALSYLKMQKNGTRAGNYDKNNFIGEKMPNEESQTKDTFTDANFLNAFSKSEDMMLKSRKVKTKPKINKQNIDSEFMMMQALEEEVAQLSLRK